MEPSAVTVARQVLLRPRANAGVPRVYVRETPRRDVVSRQLGHASIATTGNIYLHDNDEAAADGAERVGKVLGAR
jgi:integrase